MTATARAPAKVKTICPRRAIGRRESLVMIAVTVLLSSCGFGDLTIEEASRKHASVLARDPPTDFAKAPITLELPVYDAATKAPIRDFFISGQAEGYLKDKYVGHEPIPFYCYVIPMACYSEHDRSLRRVDTPRVTSLVTAVEGGPSTYQVHTPGGFALTPGFTELTKFHEWSGTVTSQNYCSPHSGNHNGQSILRFLSASLRNAPSEHTLKATLLTPLETNAFVRMRHHLFWTAQSVAIASKLNADTPMARAYSDVLDWARPSSDDPFEHAAYASLLIEKGRVLTRSGALPASTNAAASIIAEKIERSLPIARRIYYQFDDWQLVPATERIEWRGEASSATSGDGACDSPRTAERLASVGDWGRTVPILRTKNYFVDTSESLLRHNGNALSAEPMTAALELAAYPFCYRDQRANLARLKSSCSNPPKRPAVNGQSLGADPSKASVHAPLLASRPSRPSLSPRSPAIEGSSRGHGDEQYDDPNASCEQREQTARRVAALSEFSVQCRHGAPSTCDLDVVNGLGDTALMTLARVDWFRTQTYPFARAPSSGNKNFRQVPAFISRMQAVAMTHALIKSGISVGRVNPALDVNALEIAIDPFLGGAMRSGDPAAWEAQQKIVEALLEALQGDPAASIRADYHRALSTLPALQSSENGRKVPQLPGDVVSRLQNLSTRPMRTTCGQVPESWEGWIQHAPSRSGRGPVPPLSTAP